MYKKSRLTILLSLVMMLFLLMTGCVRSGVGIIMNADGTGTLEISYGVNETYYNSMNELGDDIFEGKETALVSDGDENYICYVEHKQFTSFEELETMLLELEYNTSMLPDENMDVTMNQAPEVSMDMDEADETTGDPYSEEQHDHESADTEGDYHIFKEVEVSKNSDLIISGYTFRAVTNKQDIDMSELSALGMKFDDLFRLVITVTIPENITEGSGTVDGKTMTCTITDLTAENEITAVSESTSVLSIVIIILAVVIVSFIIYMLLRGKKTNTSK